MVYQQFQKQWSTNSARDPNAVSSIREATNKEHHICGWARGLFSTVCEASLHTHRQVLTQLGILGPGVFGKP